MVENECLVDTAAGPEKLISAWAEHTCAGFDMQVFPGGHFYLDHHQGDVAAAVEGEFAGVPREAVRGARP